MTRQFPDSTLPLDVLTRLHRRAETRTGACCSALLENDCANGVMHVASAHGFTPTPEAWTMTPAEQTRVDVIFAADSPVVLVPCDLSWPAPLGAGNVSRLLVVPLKAAERRGLLALWFRQDTVSQDLEALTVLADDFVLALELTGLRSTAVLHRTVQEVLRAFSGAVSTGLDLGAGLVELCRRATETFGAERTSVWLHERRRHELVLAASSGAAAQTEGRLQTTAMDEPPVRGFHCAAADVESERAGSAQDERTTARVMVPLRGRRRALGVLIAEGVSLNGRSHTALRAYAQELGRQLSSAVENVQLLQDVIRSRRELENTFNSIDDLVAVCDLNLSIVHVNRAFARQVGLSREALLDRPVSDFVGPEICQWMKVFDLEASGPNQGARETSDPRLGGTFSVTLARLVSPKDEPMGLVMVARDITEQSLLEVEQAALRERLTQSEKLAALGQFVAGIAHELNNPLQGVLGHIELLNATVALPRSVQSQFRTVTREAERAAKIVRNLLVFAGSGRLVSRRLSLHAVISRALELRTENWREMGIEVVRTHDDTVPRLYGDPLLLQQAFLNILINAEHAVSGQPSRRIEVATTFDRERRMVVTRVRDTGPGIPSEILSRLFEPFFTTKEVGQGTGLGLAITYGIIQEHNGHISADNDMQGGGAVFTIELPSEKKTRKNAANSGKVRV